MAFDFKFPDVGEGIHEAELVEWLVKEGDTITADRPLANVETDKAVVEIPSPKTGVVLKLHAKMGDTIHVGQVIVTIGAPGEAYAGPTGAAAPTPKAGASIPQAKAQPVAAAPAPTRVPAAAPAAQAAPRPQSPAGTPAPGFVPAQIPATGILAMPHTRRMARELGIDISKIRGSGPGGRITDEDVTRMAAGGGNAPVGPPQAAVTGGVSLPAFEKASWVATGDEERVPYKGLRKKIGDHLARSNLMAPTAVQFDEVDMSELVAVREKEKPRAEKQGIKLTYLAFIVKAVAHALKEFPYVNASLDEDPQRGQEIVLKKYYNVGIAVDTPDGLIVPVIKDADKKSILQTAREITEKAALTRDRKIGLDDLRGGTFTITNIGSIGGTVGVAIVNYPEVAILALGTIRKEPRVIEDRILVRQVMGISLSFDHRVVDGALAARFGNEVKKHLEDPYSMLLEVI